MMKLTHEPLNVARNTKLQGAKHYPELALRTEKKKT